MEQGKERSRKRTAIYGGILTAVGVLMMLALSALGGGRLSLWETGFNGLLSALGILTTLCPTARLAEEDTPEVWAGKAGSYRGWEESFLQSDCRSVSVQGYF
ncbi:MAG: hypothetical protein ACLR9I_06670 [Eisenbergiella sp.]